MVWGALLDLGLAEQQQHGPGHGRKAMMNLKFCCATSAGAMDRGIQLGCPSRYCRCAAVLGFACVRSYGVGYKRPSHLTSRSLGLPSSSRTLPVDLTSANTISLLAANIGFTDRIRGLSDFFTGKEQDIMTDIGFANHFFQVLNLKSGAGLWAAPVCSTWVFMLSGIKRRNMA